MNSTTETKTRRGRTSAKTIAFALNKDGIPAPSGGDWGFSTINGNPKRGNGMYTKLKVYAGSAHRHAAQRPQAISVKSK